MLVKTLMFASLLTPIVFVSAPVSAASSPVVMAAMQSATQNTVASAKVNINQANAEQLARALHGVGMARARAIIELREQLGGFKDMEELLQVRGLGVKVLEDNKDRIEL